MIVDKHKIYLKMARDYAQMSKCRRIKVGCMIVNNGRIVSTGVNGTPKGMCNCTDHFYAHDDERFMKDHSAWSQENEIHAEMNALLYAAKSNVEVTSDCVIYCTHEPCNNCLKHIAVTGIKQIYYIEKYYNNTIDNKFKINITQLSLDEDAIKPEFVANEIVQPKQMKSSREIIVNARKQYYENSEITFEDLVEISFGQVANPSMFRADYKIPFETEFKQFEPGTAITVLPGTQFRCTGSTPVHNH